MSQAPIIFISKEAADKAAFQAMNSGSSTGSTGGSDGGDRMEARVAKLEAGVEHIQTDIGDIKTDIREFRTDFKSLHDKIENRVLWILGLMTTSTLGLAFIMAKGFKWL
jgi:hypothetical protein